MVLKRIVKEYQSITRDLDNNNYFVEADPSNMYSWEITLIGPEGSPFEGGVFSIQLDFPTNYPFKPFKMNFRTQIFHPQIIYNTMHLDFLCSGCGKWSPALTVHKTMLILITLLKDPDFENPCFPIVNKLCGNDRAKYDQIAREWTRKYAT